MNCLSAIGVEAPRGLCTVELHQGDVTLVSCDLLVVSAFQGGYTPLKGSVLGALNENHKLLLGEELGQAAFDLREQFGVWITRPLKGYPFKRVLCVELQSLSLSGSELLRSLEESVENVFVGLAILESKGVEVRRLAMPVLGTGKQGLQPAAVVGPLIGKTKAAISRSSFLQQVLFVEWSAERASLLLSEIEREFGAASPGLPTKMLIGSLIGDIRSIATALVGVTVGLQRQIATEMMEVTDGGAPSSTAVGLLARRMAELVTDDLYRGAPSIDLFRKIESLAQNGVSPWMVNYLHTLRVIGNEVVHIRDRQNRKPPGLEDGDMVMCLFCVQRVAQFWLESRRAGLATPAS